MVLLFDWWLNGNSSRVEYYQYTRRRLYLYGMIWIQNGIIKE